MVNNNNELNNQNLGRLCIPGIRSVKQVFLDDVYLRVEELVGEELQGAGEDDPVKKKSYIFILSV